MSFVDLVEPGPLYPYVDPIVPALRKALFLTITCALMGAVMGLFVLFVELTDFLHDRYWRWTPASTQNVVTADEIETQRMTDDIGLQPTGGKEGAGEVLPFGLTLSANYDTGRAVLTVFLDSPTGALDETIMCSAEQPPQAPLWHSWNWNGDVTDETVAPDGEGLTEELLFVSPSCGEFTLYLRDRERAPECGATTTILVVIDGVQQPPTHLDLHRDGRYLPIGSFDTLDGLTEV